MIFDEGIALAISEEKSTADDLLADDRKLTEKVNTAFPYMKSTKKDKLQAEKFPPLFFNLGLTG